jgi:hypothetical protein
MLSYFVYLQWRKEVTRLFAQGGAHHHAHHQHGRHPRNQRLTQSSSDLDVGTDLERAMTPTTTPHK